MSETRLRLFGYWRSSAAYRVRIALNLKGIAVEQTSLDLRTGAQRSAPYLSVNPQGLVPALEIGGDLVLTQSTAILEWLEETYPTPPLLPEGAGDRALVRTMVSIIACDIHPLNNLRVLEALRGPYRLSEAEVRAWIARWICEGFTALEHLVERHGAGLSFGDSPSFADCHLVPQVLSAQRFEIDLAGFPRCVAAAERAARLPAFLNAHPSRQPDADG